MKKIIFILSFLLANVFMFSQIVRVNCETYTTNIVKLYNQGAYYTILTSTDSLIKHCKFSKDAKENIYKYTIAAAYKDGDDSIYSFYGQKLLELNPHYTYREGIDPEGLDYLRYKFKVYPKYTFGMILGTNQVFVDRINVFQIMDSADVTQPYSSNLAINASILLQYNLNRFFSFAYYGGIYFSNFTKYTSFYNGFLETTYRESIQGVNNQGVLKMYFPIKNRFSITPYIMLGGFFDYKLRVNARISLDVHPEVNPNYADFKLPNITASTIQYHLFYRNPMRLYYNFGYLGGGGINYTSQNFSLFAEVVFQRGMILHNNPEIRYLTPVLPNYYYVDDDIILNKLFIRVGFTYNLKYKVKEK